jgi:hypothetical protein
VLGGGDRFKLEEAQNADAVLLGRVRFAQRRSLWSKYG